MRMLVAAFRARDLPTTKESTGCSDAYATCDTWRFIVHAQCFCFPSWSTWCQSNSVDLPCILLSPVLKDPVPRGSPWEHLTGLGSVHPAAKNTSSRWGAGDERDHTCVLCPLCGASSDKASHKWEDFIYLFLTGIDQVNGQNSSGW